MPTPHNQAHLEDIASTVLLPGDPKRAELIAETFFDDPVCFNEVRGMLGFTGTYKGHPVSVMGTGMGMPSIGIVAHELIDQYEVTTLIRVGSCGAYRRKMNLGDLIIAQGACTDSNFAHQYDLPGTYSAIADYELLEGAVTAAKRRNLTYHVGNILSSDIFYYADPLEWKRWQSMGILGSEMESYALYCEAARASVRALGVFTVSDNLVTGQQSSPERRQRSFDGMVAIALEAAFGADSMDAAPACETCSACPTELAGE